MLDLTELRSETPGAANALPRVGPLVISEIMYLPATGQAEYVELVNVTDLPVSLFDSLRPTNVWELDGVGSFKFPSGTVLDPCSTLIVCSTNPAAFRAQYGIDPSVPVFGPWSGALDDDGETLKLLRPGNPEFDGTVPYYRVDHVSYRTNTPWPQPVIGASLERMPVQSFGNDPANWRATPPGGTPGQPVSNRLPVISAGGYFEVPQQALLSFTVSAADLDAPWQTVSLSATQLPSGATFDPASGMFSWLPSAAQPPGDYSAWFMARDTTLCDDNHNVHEVVIHVVPQLTIAMHYTISDGMQLSFSALPGETYFVEYCTDLARADWQVYQEIVASEAGVTTVPGLIGPDAARFYRVRWSR
jgi:hypothetical protein